MYRKTIRLVDELAERLQVIAKTKGTSVNAVITEMAWHFVADWQAWRKQDVQQRKGETNHENDSNQNPQARA